MNINEVAEKVRDKCRLKRLAYSTEKTYLAWIRQYARWLSANPVSGSSRDKVEGYLTHMAKADYSAVSQNQAFNALLFFYRECLGQELEGVDALRAKRPQRERYAPTFDETRRLMDDVRDSNGYPLRLVVHLLYGCGLRVSEPVGLRLKDVDLANSRLTIRQAKGAKDRLVPLPCRLARAVEIQMAKAKAVADQDRMNGLPVQLPDRLGVKYPRLAFSPDWAFLFPGNSPCRHPRTGQMVRYRLLEENVQRAVRASVRRLDLPPMLTPHSLRHAWATHALNAGANIRDIQVCMGHVSLETTQVYVHAEVGRMRSPIDAMELAGIG
jgi:integron integrase